MIRSGSPLGVPVRLRPDALLEDAFVELGVQVGVVPFGALGISAWVGIFFPYHPMPLRFRWEHRRPRGRMLWRWLTLAVIPYVLVPWLAVALMIPSLLLWGFTSVHGLSSKLPDHDLGLGVGIAYAVAILCSFASIGGGSRWPSAAARDFSRSSPTQPAAEKP